MISCLNCTAQLTDTSIVNNLRRHFKVAYSYPFPWTKGHGENKEDIVLCGKTTEIAYLTQFCSNQRMSENKVPLKLKKKVAFFSDIASLVVTFSLTNSLTHSHFATLVRAVLCRWFRRNSRRPLFLVNFSTLVILLPPLLNWHKGVW